MAAGRRRSGITVSGLSSAHTGRGGVTGDPYRIVARFLRATGLAAVANREIRVVLSLAEAADVLGSVPALVFEDPEDFSHLARTLEVLRRAGRKRDQA